MQQAKIRIAATAVAVLSGISAIPAFVFFFIALFAFDAPDSKNSIVAYLNAFSLISIPSLLILSCVSAIHSVVKPSAWLFGFAIFAIIIAAILFNVLFDPFKLRYYPPPQEFNNSAFTDASGRHVVRRNPLPGPERMICHDIQRIGTH